MTIIINDQIHGGKNNMGVTRDGRHYPLKEWARWRDKTVSDIKNQTENEETITVDASMKVYYISGDLRRRDLPAMLDSIFHCLERAKVLEDDKLVKMLTWIPVGFKRNEPRCEIELETL